MKPHVIQNGESFQIGHQRPEIHKKIPPGIYTLELGPMGFYLAAREGFALPKKIYGNDEKFATRVIQTHKYLGHGITTLLAGPKGCGKTLTAKIIAMRSKLPVIVITSPWTGDGMLNFLENLPNPCAMFIDEFEKTYKEGDDRNWFLSLLDGVSTNRHLFVLTSNQIEIGEYFTNRPGRVRYTRIYETLPKTIIEQMIDDMVPAKQKHLKEAIKAAVSEIGNISPDSLVELIKESLLWEEDPKEFLSFFNVRDDFSGLYNVEATRSVWVKDKKKPLDKWSYEYQNIIDGDWSTWTEAQMFGRWPWTKGCVKKEEVKYTERYCRPFKKSFRDRSTEGAKKTFMALNFLEKVQTLEEEKKNGRAHTAVAFNEGSILDYKKLDGVVTFSTTCGWKFTCTPTSFADAGS